MFTRLYVPTLFVTLIALAMATSAQAPAGESFCGRTYPRPPAIEPGDGIGPLRLRSSMIELRRSCPGAIDTGSFLDAGFYVRAFGSRIEVLGDQPVLGDSADRVVRLIRVSGGTGIRAADGIGPGSTIGDAKRAWGELQVVGCSAQVTYAYPARRSGVGLRFTQAQAGICEDASAYPESLTIRAVEIFTPVD